VPHFAPLHLIICFVLPGGDTYNIVSSVLMLLDTNGYPAIGFNFSWKRYRVAAIFNLTRHCYPSRSNARWQSR
jgi:hypothetical protein